MILRPSARVSISCNIVHDLVLAVFRELRQVRVVEGFSYRDRDFERWDSVQGHELAISLSLVSDG